MARPKTKPQKGTFQYRREHKAKGLCARCTRPAVLGCTLCQHHRILKKEQNKRYIARHKAMGLCRHCRRSVIPGRKVCQYHRILKAIHMKKQIDKYHKSRKCPCCGLLLHPEIDEGYLSCTGCRQTIPTLQRKMQN